MSKRDSLPNIQTFTTIGGSPIPGFTLRQVLRGHEKAIARIAWSPDGSYLASPSYDRTIRIWATRSGGCVRSLEQDVYPLVATWSPDGQRLASSNGRDIKLWETATGKIFHPLEGHTSTVRSIMWSPDGQILASAACDNTIRLWDSASGKHLRTLLGHTSYVNSVAWSPDSRRLVSTSDDNTVRVWDVDNSNNNDFQLLEGQNNVGFAVAWSPDGQHIASACGDYGVYIWESDHGKAVGVLEGHSGLVHSVAFSENSRWLVSKSDDDTVRLWRSNPWTCVAVLDEPNSKGIFGSASFHPHLPMLATLGEGDTIIRIWELDEALLFGQASDSIHYTTAKLVLVGDSGVGKTGLGWRLAHNEFKEHASR